MERTHEREDRALDLSGVWDGVFSYERGRPPVSFTGTLTETGAWLAGSTEEVATSGPGNGRKLRANLEGRRTGAEVTFFKTYEQLFAGYDSVQYEGRVNAGATEIEGRWTIFGKAAGPFLMIRSGAAHAEAERRAVAKV